MSTPDSEEARRMFAALLPRAVERLAELLQSPDPEVAAMARAECERRKGQFDALRRALTGEQCE